MFDTLIKIDTPAVYYTGRSITIRTAFFFIVDKKFLYICTINKKSCIFALSNIK